MKRIILSVMVALMMVPAFAADNIVKVESKSMTLVLKAKPGSKLKTVYFGARLNRIEDALAGTAANTDAYPAYGQGITEQYALAATHADGDMALDLLVEGVANSTEPGAKVTKITLKDKTHPFWVKVCYRVWDDSEMIETWTEIEHQEKKVVKLRKFDSICLPVHRGDVWVSHFHGQWANEAGLVEEKVNPGILKVENRDGVRNAQTSRAEMMISLDGKPQENSGAVIGAALCYSGNYDLTMYTDASEYHWFQAGIAPDNSEYPLKAKEVFDTPIVAFTYSNEGLSGASRNFHRWARNHRIAHGNVERKVLLNSWEGAYFDIDEPVLAGMMQDISSMGGELFVMDDGWFGEKYPRLNDHTSLGDWMVDKNKLPHGIGWLVKEAKKNGVDFGIWIEPEMACTVSELYEKHPDWIVNSVDREPVTGRGGHQVVLDMGNPAVQDFVFGIVDNLMTENPGIKYIKWDSNMDIRSHGSHYLKPEEQSKLYINFHKGFAATCDRIRAKYPDLTIQSCASGGGRANYGVLPWFDEFWTSDNTDALQRIYMQWGTSYFFPAITMACHISESPNHQTRRIIPLKFRVDVAMSGRLGMEMQPSRMTDDEKAFCRQAIADYKRIRPVVQFGDVYRLVSPYDDKGFASMMYSSENKNEAVFYWWQTQYYRGQKMAKVKFAGLDPQKVYKVTELNVLEGDEISFNGKSFSGAYLMDSGLEIKPQKNTKYTGGYASRVLHLVAE